MAIKYDFYRNPASAGDKDDYHVRAISGVTISTDQVTRLIQHACSLNESDVAACLSALGTIIGQAFSQGNRIHLDHLGSFGPTIGGEVVRTKKGDLKLRNGHVRSIVFKPEPRLVNSLRDVELVCANEAGRYSKPRTDEEIKAAIELHFTERPFISGKAFYQLTGQARTTAYKTLARLIEEGYLKREAMGVYVKAE